MLRFTEKTNKESQRSPIPGRMNQETDRGKPQEWVNQALETSGILFDLLRGLLRVSYKFVKSSFKYLAFKAVS